MRREPPSLNHIYLGFSFSSRQLARGRMRLSNLPAPGRKPSKWKLKGGEEDPCVLGCAVWSRAASVLGWKGGTLVELPQILTFIVEYSLICLAQCFFICLFAFMAVSRDRKCFFVLFSVFYFTSFTGLWVSGVPHAAMLKVDLWVLF